MEDDLRRQASKLYKEHSQQEEIPTSDSLSMKKIIYVSLGILVALSVLIYGLGGAHKHTDPVVAAIAPRTVAKEPFPPETPAPPPPSPAPAAASQTEIKSPDTPSASPQSRPPSNLARHKQAEPTSLTGETPRRADIPDTQEKGGHARNRYAHAAPGGGRVAESKPAPANVPEVSPLEVARQELARDIVLEKSSSMAGLINSPGENLDYQGWKASADGPDEYQVVFSFRDKSSGATVQYVWRVKITGRTITPQSYYARKLS